MDGKEPKKKQQNEHKNNNKMLNAWFFVYRAAKPPWPRNILFVCNLNLTDAKALRWTRCCHSPRSSANRNQNNTNSYNVKNEQRKSC